MPQLRAAAELLRRSTRVLVMTGAGISADSGLPTYRGIGGLYDSKDTEDGVPIETALSASMFARDPALTWKHIARIEAACRGARYNAAHAALAALERHCARVCVITQNVDGFHGDAGSREVIEMHGNLHHLHCLRCSHADTVCDYAQLDIPPSCPRCGGLLRPRVVLFGELLPDAAVRAYEAATASAFDVVISVGTTAVFPYIAAPVLAAARSAIPTVEINPVATDLSAVVMHQLPLRAAEALPVLCAAALG